MALTRSSGATGLGGVGTRCRSPILLPVSSNNAALIPVPPISIARVRGSFMARFLLAGSVASLFQVRLEASSGQAYFCAILSRRSDRGGANANWDDPGENIGARRPGGAAVDRKRIGGGPTGAVR